MNVESLIGTRIGGYRIEALLAPGRRSVIFEATDLTLGRTVALKLLADGAADDSAARERFLREWRRAAALDHPNVIPVYDVGELDARPYAALRLVDGASLRARIQAGGPLAADRALFILQQAAHALDAAHAEGLVHGDLSAEHLLVERHSDHVYLTGFGMGPASEPGPEAAPEQRAGGPPDARSDLYALAGVLQQVLTGRPPAAAEAASAALAPPLQAVLAQGLAADPARRYASARELARAARTALRQRPLDGLNGDLAAAPAVFASPEPWPAPAQAPRAGPAGVGTVTVAVPRYRRRVRRGGAAVVALLAAAALLAALYASQRSSGSEPENAAPTGLSAAPTVPASPTQTAVQPVRQGVVGAAAALVAQIHDPAIASSCKKARHPGGLATMLCSSRGSSGSPIDLHVDHFGSGAVVDRAFRNEALGGLRRHGGELPAARGAATGSCGSDRWLGTASWQRASGGQGALACFTASSSEEDCEAITAPRCAVLYWTYEPENLYVRAATPASASGELFAWWQEHRDRFGTR